MSTRRSAPAAGALGIVLILLATISAASISDLPYLGAGSRYSAEFSEAAGLRPGNEVRVAGVKVGQVASVELEGDRVKVDFDVQDVEIGDTSSASIQIKTILGQKFLAIDPSGDRSLGYRGVIPLERTTSPYDVVAAFQEVSSTVGQIDQQQLATSMETLAQAFSETPDSIRAGLDGITQLSQTISSRDDELRSLLEATNRTTEILADRNQVIMTLITDAGGLLDELNARQQAIAQLLTGTKRLSDELTGLIRDNEAQINPALQQLHGVVQILQNNNDNIARAIEMYAPFVRLYTNIVGNGRWFDQMIVNVFPPALPDVPGYREPIRQLGVDPVRSPGGGQ